MQKKSLIFILPFLLFTACQSRLVVINEVKLQKGYTTNVLKDNLATKRFTSEISDYVLKDADKTSAIAPTEVLMNFFSILFASNNTEDLIHQFGFIDYDDLALSYKNMQSFLNYENSRKNFLKTASFYQIVDIDYDEESLQEIYQKTDISVMKSPLKKATDEANTWINEKTEITIKAPKIEYPGMYSYNVTNLKDSFPESSLTGLSFGKMTYYETPSQQYEVNNVRRVISSRYYYNEQKGFQVVVFPIFTTDLVFVFPDEGVTLSSISFLDLDLSLLQEKAVDLTVPFFKVDVKTYDIAKFMLTQLGEVLPFDRFIASPYFLSLSTNIFEFNKHGISGQSITLSGVYETSILPPIDPVEIVINRPFYALSTYQDEPLFAMKVMEIN